MTAELGTNVDKLGVGISADELVWLHARWARVVAAPDRAMDQLMYVKAMKAAGVQVLLCFDADAYRAFGVIDNPETWRRAARWAKVLYSGLIAAVEPVNEPDGEGYESSQMSVETVNGMLAAHRNAWGTGMPIIGAATSSGQVSYYEQIETDILDGLSFHPYAKWSPEDLTRIIDEHAAIGLPLWITEVGVNGGDDEQDEFLEWTLPTIQAHPSVKVCMWFCGHAYGEWGLKRDDGSWRPAAVSFKRIAPQGGSVPDQYDVGAGLRAMMAEDHTTPVTDSTWLPLGRTPSFIEESTGANGTIYRWSLVLNTGWRYRPVAA